MAKLEDMIKQLISTLPDDPIDEQFESDYKLALDAAVQEVRNESMTSDDPISDHYDALVLSQQGIFPDYFLTDPEIVGYDDVEFQQAIYQWASSSVRMAGSSIKDLGCGRGDFKSVIDSNFSFWPNPNPYIGIDFNPLMVDAAKKKYEGIDARHGDWLTLTDQTDYTFCIGSLNDDNGKDKWEVFTNALFHALGNTTNQVIFIFNVGESAEGSFSFELDKLMTILPAGYPFQIDCSRFEGICKLIVYCKKFE